MDFKRFGLVVVMVGLLVAGYGGVQLAVNLPVRAEQSDGSGFMGTIENFGNQLQAASENSVRKHRRGSATKWVLAGGLVVFLGFGIMASAKDGSMPARS